RIVVAPALARSKVERIACRQRDERVGRHRFADAFQPPRPEVGVTRNARGVIEELPNGSWSPAGRQRREVAADRVIEAYTSALDELHHSRGGELLGDRADTIHRVRRRGHGILHVSQTVALADQCVTTPYDDDG